MACQPVPSTFMGFSTMSFAYLPIFTGDYLRDTRHLSPLRHGVYLLLLMHCWDQKGPVPLDEQEAAGIANCRSTDEVEALRYVLNRYFIQMDDGWYNKRMAKVIADAEQIAGYRRKGGLEKARRQRERVLAASQRAQAVLKQCSSSASPGIPIPIPIPIQEEVKRPLSSNEDKSRNAKRSDPIPFEKIVDLYHETLPMLPRVVAMTPNRKAQIRGRYATGAVEDLEDWQTFFRLVAGSAFLTGRSQPSNGRKPFRADLAWLTKEENFMKILEEKYS
jgi:uncharacterized protein YdaU (DUF1376 family)